MTGRFAAAAAQEELVAAACAATARWVPGSVADLHALAAAHLASATALGATARAATARPWRALYTGLQVMLAAVVGTELGALVWLRRQEQRLLDVYVALEALPTLTVAERQRLRWELVPAAFERFGRVDRWIMLREEQGVFA